ncbi:hypothetical protein NUU61_003354 [Penicillium alfredii]|uniref:Uncharacterized protein n=1 Tax=Penicillium alfredii TaxID=1506179 RepID=A0A9W9KI28_9EURO|nr:uncharacterized protein NUU61_003354 [Penicillium alfredii]KAJ5106007.1 hypothetical protein NUU61_003354 [Penicillium alfredii]
MEQIDAHQLFNTSWTLHRLSPLHHSKDCETLLDNESALKTYATRLRDQLTGAVIAGIHSASAAEDDALSKTGALKECLWQPITAGSPRDAASSRRSTPSFPGILVTLEYEFIVYKAALLADSDSSNGKEETQREGSTFLPLLLTRFPNALRQTFISFLSANFDTYCSPLRLPSALLCSGLETYVEALRDGRSARASDYIEDVIKELQLTLSFSPSIAPALRSLNVSIARASLAGFLRDGPSTAASKTRSLQQKLRSPLFANLTTYLESHLAMTLDMDGSATDQRARQHVRLSKVACAAFVLGSEGRMKLVVSANRDEDGASVGRGRDSSFQRALRASETLLRAVVRRAAVGEQTT